MADTGSSNTGVVAVLVIFVIVAVAAFFAWQGGIFGGNETDIHVDVDTPAAVQPGN